jgi:hypothetical protein
MCLATRGVDHVLPFPSAHPGIGRESRYVRNSSTRYALPHLTQGHSRSRAYPIHQPSLQRLSCYLAIDRTEFLYPRCMVFAATEQAIIKSRIICANRDPSAPMPAVCLADPFG